MYTSSQRKHFLNYCGMFIGCSSHMCSPDSTCHVFDCTHTSHHSIIRTFGVLNSALNFVMCFHSFVSCVCFCLTSSCVFFCLSFSLSEGKRPVVNLEDLNPSPSLLIAQARSGHVSFNKNDATRVGCKSCLLICFADSKYFFIRELISMSDS